MNVQLATSAEINSLAGVEAFVQAEAAHWLALFMPHLGSIHQVVETILT
jgi:methylaspartate ammonia-lyase